VSKTYTRRKNTFHFAGMLLLKSNAGDKLWQLANKQHIDTLLLLETIITEHVRQKEILIEQVL